jgi:hypothetical protein
MKRRKRTLKEAKRTAQAMKKRKNHLAVPDVIILGGMDGEWDGGPQ